MKTRRMCLHLAAFMLAAASDATRPTIALAQTARFDTSIVRTATLGSLIRSAQAGDSIARLASVSPTAHALLTRMLAQLDRPAAKRLPLQLIAGGEAPIGVISRFRRPTALTGREAAALDTLAAVMEQELPDPLTTAMGRNGANQLLDSLEAFNVARRRQSMSQSLVKLDRFERKFGPGAPRLNAVEVVLNYGAQWLPGFGPNPEGWPSRVEVIASYVPAYLTVANGKARAVTIAEFGPRIYLWRPGWGGEVGGVLRPGYISFGAALAGERDGVFASPFKGSSRFGAFLGWGEAKVAVIGGRNARVLITRQVQVLPWIF